MSEPFVRGSEAAWESVGDGVRRQLLAGGPDLMLVSVAFVRGAVGTPHHHPHRQVTYVARGRFDVTIDGRTETLTAGDSFFVAAGLVHGVAALEDGALIDVFTPARDDFRRPPAVGADV